MAYSSIVKPSVYFNTKLYTGNGGTNALTGVGFKPDLTWIKCRDDTHNPNWFDSVRGATKRLSTHSSAAESTVANSLTSFDNDGFTLGASGGENSNSNTYVAWNFKAATYGATYYSKVEGGSQSNSDTASALGITAGTIAGNTWRVAVNRDCNFSIVKYVGNGSAGATVGHGLGVVPEMVIVKSTTGATNWAVYHNSLGNFAKYLYLDATNAVSTDSDFFDAATNSTTVTLGSNSAVNSNGQTYMAYCFASKTGYSKFGSYTGNGNVNGNFIYTGFKPSFILRKRTDDAGAWLIQDNKRPGSNRAVADSLPTDQNVLRANDSSAEEYNNELDILSNGFKLRADNSFGNSSGATYIYMAIAEEPLVANSGTDGVPATAR